MNNALYVCVFLERPKRLLALLAVAVCPDVFVEEDEDEEEEDEEEENDVKMIKAATKRNTTVNITNAGRLL